MLFEKNLSFPLLKIPITLVNSVVIMVSATDFKMIPRKAVKMSITALAGFSVYTVLSSLLIIKYLDYQNFLRVFSMTISGPAIVLLYSIYDTSFARPVFIRATHILFTLYITVTATLINTALHGTETSDILLRVLFSVLITLFNFYLVRGIRRGLHHILSPIDFLTERGDARTILVFMARIYTSSAINKEKKMTQSQGTDAIVFA